ncbi:MAG: hypothetical protein LUE90_06430 [Clostridiales bacterium]|nr:hypothetical protein [Clostridiales bacterium]
MSNYKVLHVWMGTRKVGTLAVAGPIKFDEKRARRIAEDVREIVFADLRKYLNL